MVLAILRKVPIATFRGLFLAIIFTGSCCISKAQFNAHSFDQKYAAKWVHFGIPVGYSTNNFRIKLNNTFLRHDSILTVTSTGSPGFHTGIITSLHLGRNWDLRFVPSLAFSGKTLIYQTFQDSTVIKYTESVNLELPLLLKFKSEPYKDMRAYTILGATYTYDLASNVNARNIEDLITIDRHDLQVVIGFGIEFYTQYVILAPEIKLSQGLLDIHSPNPQLQYSNVLQHLFSRVISFTLNIEG